MRNKRTLLAGLTAILLLSPILAQAVTAEELGVQIQALLTQLAALKQQLGIVSSTSQTIPNNSAQNDSCPQFSSSLSVGMKGDDVLRLQQFLVAHDLMSAGLTTSYFGSRTEAAVRNWQASHAISPSGIVGPLTRASLAQNCTTTPLNSASCPIAPPPTRICSAGWRANTDAYGCTTSYTCSIPLPTTPTTPTYGACTAISLQCPSGTHEEVGSNCSRSCVNNTSTQSGSISASATSGMAPLTVTFSGTALNAAYSLDFGDGTPLYSTTCSSGCGQLTNVQQTHTYTSTGAFTAKLTSHNQPAAPYYTTATVVVTVGGSSSGFTATPTSGVAPLAVTFTIPSTPNQNKTLYFGDGLSDTTGCQNTAAWTVTHTYATSSTFYPYLATPCTSGSTYSLGNATIIVASTSAATSISVTTAASTVAKGQDLSISWNSQNAPSGSVALLRLVNAQTGSGAGIVVRAQNTTGSYTWTVPTASAVACADCPGIQVVQPGSYRISAEMYTPPGAYLGDTYPPANPTSPTFLAMATSSSFTITAP